jgi:tetratricopeptide (TPR) repeat protein
MTRLINKLSLSFLIALLSVPVTSQLVLAGEEQRAPPEARTAGTLSPQVMRAVSEIQEMMSPEDEGDEPDMEGAKLALDDLRDRRWDRMNDFEKSTVLNFYTNYYLSTEDYANALLIFEEMLTIEELREDTRLRTLRSLGQLYMAEERWQEAIGAYERWRELSLEEDVIVYRGLSYSYYQMEDFESALPFWLDYMNLSLETGEELGRDDYAYLNGIYFTLEDFESALELTKTMIVLFDDPTDWMNLSAVYASLDNEERRVQSLNLAYLKGYVDDENRFLNLGQSMAGIDAPWSGADIMEVGREQGYIEDNQDNLEILSQMYLIASAYEEALTPALAVAEMSDSGDGWDTVGYIHYVTHNYEEAVEAFERAVDVGNLSNPADTWLFLSRAHIELDNFQEALDAARRSADVGDENDREAADSYIQFINSTQQRYNIIEQRKQESIDFYESYPPLI